MRSLELATEREKDTGINLFVNVMYGVGSDYGLRPGLALLWALGLYLVAACFIFFCNALGTLCVSNLKRESIFFGEQRDGLEN